MPLRTAAVALFAAAALASSTGAVANASTVNASTANASTVNASTASGTTVCASVTRSVAGLTAAQAIRVMASEMPHACGFTVSGQFDGPGFNLDGWELDGTSTYGALGGAHIVWYNQGMVLDFYRVGNGEFLRIYEAGKPNAAPDINVKGEWQAFGISNALVKKLGSAKWIKLTAAEQKKINPDLGVPVTASALASDVAKGSGKPWKLGGTKTVRGVHCTVLIAPVNNSAPGFLGESLYVNTATGLPVGINYVSQDSQSVTSTFGHWATAATVTAPPASKVVQP
ncbi:MAG TPA: hypothetical protein VGG16_23910 [Streptosporangiaceae bacterium]